MLLSAIDTCTSVDDLVHMTTIEFPLIRAAVRGRADENGVLAVLDEATQCVGERCVRLKAMHRPGDQLAVKLPTAGPPSRARGLMKRSRSIRTC